MRPTQFLSILLLLSLLSSMIFENSALAAAFEPPVPKEAPWQFIIIPYGWVFGMNGTMTARGTTANVNVTVGDTISNLKDIDFIFQLHLEAVKHKWSLMVDTTYLELTKSASVGPFGASITPRLALVDFGAFYKIKEGVLNKNPNKPVYLEIFGGGRYFNIKTTIRPQRLPTVSATENFITPIVGLRLISQLSKSFKLILRGDYGGFSVDDVDSTWSASLFGQYEFKDYFALAFGFRALGIDYSVDSGSNRFAMNTRFYGPAIGLAFRF